MIFNWVLGLLGPGMDIKKFQPTYHAYMLHSHLCKYEECLMWLDRYDAKCMSVHLDLMHAS